MNIFIRYKWLIIAVTVLSAVAALFFSWLRPVYYDSSISFSINRINLQETEDYQYDGYYAIQAADLFSQTVMSWFLTPSVLLEIYERAKINPEIKSIPELSSRFKAKKYSPQSIVVRYKERDYQTADNIAKAIDEIVKEKTLAANQSSDKKALFEVVPSKPVIVKNTPNIWIDLIIGIISGLIVGSIIAYLIGYFKKPVVS